MLDPTALERLTATLGGDPADLADILESFLAEAPQLLREMERAAGTNDLSLLQRSAHSLKSNARDLGAMRMADMCQAIETTLRDRQTLNDPATTVGSVLREWTDVEQALVAELGRIRG